MEKTVRTAREIKIPSLELSNQSVKAKIGAMENRDAPKTIYIQISFWVCPKEEFQNVSNSNLHRRIEKEIEEAYGTRVKPLLANHGYFTRPKENIFIKNVPDNLNYNSKRNYVSVELYLHTVNLDKKEDFLALNPKKDARLYEAAKEIANKLVEEEFFKDQKSFLIFKKSS